VDIITKMQVDVPVEKVFEAFVNPNEIGGFWFSSSSSRWEAGKTITLEYKEYDAVLDIQVKAVHLNSQIEFTWGERSVSIQFEASEMGTVVTTIEKAFDEKDIDSIIMQKEGWVYMLSCLKAYLEHNVKIRAALL